VLILLRPLLLHLPLLLVLVLCATVDVDAVVEVRKAAVLKSTQKDTAWCIQIFLDSNTTERATYLLQNFTWYSGSYTRRTAGCLSHSRFCLAS